MKYQAERDCFAFFKKNISDEALKEYETVIRDLHTRYNTTIRENRFIAGGAVKVFTYALLRASGVRVRMHEDGTTDDKLILPNNKMLSIKSTFVKKKPAPVRLINTMGKNKATNWTTATLFIIAGQGILYADPSMVLRSDIKKTQDALTIRRAVLDKLAKQHDYLIQADISYKQPTKMAKLSHRASMVVAQQIMFDNKVLTLLKQMENLYHKPVIEAFFFKFSYSYRSLLKIINSIINQSRDKSPPR